MTRDIMEQTRERIGQYAPPDNLVSLFEPHTEIIRNGKGSKLIEFGQRTSQGEFRTRIKMLERGR
jgi:hypothetical protein